MSATNGTKSLELEESVFSSLRQAIGGEEVFSMSIGEDLIPSYQAIFMRLGLLQRSRDVVETMESEDGGQSSGWEIVLAFVERGEVGYREESKVGSCSLSWSRLICDLASGYDIERGGEIADRLPDRRARHSEHLPAHDVAVQEVHSRGCRGRSPSRCLESQASASSDCF